MFAKFIFARFLPPIERFVVLHVPNLRPFRKKKEIKTEQIVPDDAYLAFIFSDL